MTRPSRRGVLGGFAVLAVPTAPALASTASGPSPDAALLVACAAYMEKETSYNEAFRQEGDAEEAGNKAEVRRLSLLQRGLAQEQEADLGVIIETRAMTQDGKAAKAAVAMTLVQTNSAHEPLTTEAALLWSLAEDLAGKPLVPPG